MRDLIIKNRYSIAAVVILLALISSRLPYLANHPAEAGERWRQPDTHSMIINLIEDGFNIFRPQLNYDGPKPNYAELEFPVYAFLSAVLFLVIGESFVIPRLISLIFFALSAYYLYLLMKRYFSFVISALTMAIYCLLPISLFYSRAIIPDPSMMFFFIAGYYYFVKWFETGRGLFVSAVLISLGILTKPPVAFIGLAILILCIRKFGPSFIKEKRLWLYAAITLLPCAAWITFGRLTAEFNYITDVATIHVFKKAFIGFFTPETFKDMIGRIKDMIGVPVICAAVIGMSRFRKGFPLPVFLFVLSMCVEMVTIMGAIQLRYYLFPFAPAMSVMAALAFDSGFELLKLRAGDWGLWFKGLSIGAMLVLIFISSNNYAKPLLDVSSNQWIIDGAHIIDENSHKGDVFVIGVQEPSLLSLSHREGYRANLAYYDFIPTEHTAELDYFIANGANYFYVYNGYIYNDKGGEYLALLEENYKKTDFGNGHVIYDLRYAAEGAP